MKTLHAIERLARENPIEFFMLEASYSELSQRSIAVAAHVAREAGPRQRPVAVIGHKQPKMVHAFIGCLKAGHPYLQIESSMKPCATFQKVSG